ncbi:hypothetical protein PDESU_06143 [Pontiella desulfatans]|uniref:Type 4 fimbrial biogenesis protein PilX N-terminal domain-containing protein n=1 Tax=Pontiella desulfatans TaxID=2750659 RepID=A0A6C2UEA5_PONDE|nr:hypothetical protein [Pontiella desulfatans]VGO17546.1 hypothetical protein PDESU_06143 [Pontiella desulfatans]
MKNRSNKSGGALVAVMVVMVAMAFLTAGMMKLSDVNGVESVCLELGDQAFWVAEAGLQEVVHKLRSDSGYRDLTSDDPSSPDFVTNSFGQGGCSVYFWATDSSRTNFIVQSQGSVRGMQRKVAVDVTMTDLGPFTLLGLGGKLRLDGQKSGAPSIYGDIYQDGAVDIADDSGINGNVYSTAEGYEAITEDGKIEVAIDTDHFSSYFTSTAPPPPKGDTIDLAGGILSVNGSVNPTNLIDSVGGGTLVVNGDQKFGQNVVIGSNLDIYVNGKLSFSKNATLGDNVNIYVAKSAEIKKDNGTVFGTGTGCSLLVEGELDIKKSLVFQGLIYSGKKITADKDLTVSGTMVAGNGFWLKKEASIHFNSGVIPSDVKNDMMITTFFVHLSEWQEMAVN